MSVTEARAILGDDVLGADETASVFRVAINAPPIPFTTDQLKSANPSGEILVLRLAQDGEGPLTLLRMIQLFPESFDKRLLRQMGYQLKDDWGIELEPLAATATCTSGWALVRKDILADTRNLTYDEQEPALLRYAPSCRRRSAIEVVYDTLLYYEARRVRLLEKAWDWSSSATVDGGYLNVGGFGPTGLQILSFSGAVRHGALGVCPTRQPAV